MDDRRPVGPVLHAPGLGLGHGAADVLGDGPDLRVRHLPLRAEDAAEPADDRHQIGGGHGHVEVGPAVLDALGQVLVADRIGARRLGLARRVTLGEGDDGHVAARRVRQGDRAAELLLGVADVQAGADVALDGLGELHRLHALDERDGLGRRVLPLAVDPGIELAVALAPGH